MVSTWVGIGGVVLAMITLIWSVWSSSKKDNESRVQLQSKLEEKIQNLTDISLGTQNEVKLLRKETNEQQISTAEMARDIKTLYHNDARIEKQMEVVVDMVGAVNRLADAVAKRREHECAEF